MINVIFTRAPDALTLEVTGHANAGPHGQDLVCASVSVLAQTYVAALITAGFEPEYRIEPGDAVCICGFGKLDKPNDYQKAKQVVGETIIKAIHHTVYTGMAYLAESYPEYIRVTQE